MPQTLYRESALISSNYAENYFSDSTTLDEIDNTTLHPRALTFPAEIWIIDTHGQILINTASAITVENAEPKVIPDFDVTDFGKPLLPHSETFTVILHGNYLSVFSPITVNYKVRGYVIIHKPESAPIVNLSNQSDKCDRIHNVCTLIFAQPLSYLAFLHDVFIFRSAKLRRVPMNMPLEISRQRSMSIPTMRSVILPPRSTIWQMN
ncbi:MAG: hypothetical protein ACLU6P_06570 [Roseburia intestinalis]